MLCRVPVMRLLAALNDTCGFDRSSFLLVSVPASSIRRYYQWLIIRFYWRFGASNNGE